jgi:hypothetical protein
MIGMNVAETPPIRNSLQELGRYAADASTDLGTYHEANIDLSRRNDNRIPEDKAFGKNRFQVVRVQPTLDLFR